MSLFYIVYDTASGVSGERDILRYGYVETQSDAQNQAIDAGEAAAVTTPPNDTQYLVEKYWWDDVNEVLDLKPQAPGAPSWEQDAIYQERANWINSEFLASDWTQLPDAAFYDPSTGNLMADQAAEKTAWDQYRDDLITYAGLSYNQIMGFAKPASVRFPPPGV